MLEQILQAFLGISVAVAMEIAPYSTTSPEVAIVYWANVYKVNAQEMFNVARCESNFDPTVQSKFYDKKGKRERSFGVAQINLDAHPDITEEQAKMPQWSLSWMAQQFARGDIGKEQWTCYRDIYE